MIDRDALLDIVLDGDMADAILALERPDPRIARIAALLPEPSPLGGVDMIDAEKVRAILADGG